MRDGDKAETQGLVFLEAAHFGLPIVAVKSDASLDWVRRSFGRITEDNPREISSVIDDLLKENTAKLSKEAVKFARRNSLRNTAQDIINAYKSVTKRGSRKGQNRF